MPVPFSPPLTDIQFVLSHLIGNDRLRALPAFEGIGDDVIEAVLSEAGKIAAEIYAPLNDVGDKTGVKLVDGVIRMPPGFGDAYKAYIDGGWNGLPVEESHGGQGLPWLLAMAVNEMMQAANIGLALCGLLNQGAIELLSVHGSDALKAIFLPNLVSGVWSGTMNLTEPQAGSDVGAVKTKAVKHDDHYLISGQKIFISYGDHDMTDNIVHLVLARLPDAPEGTRGLSLFLVPKILVNADGTLGALNDVRVVSTEHKLGQHSSPTCVMAYGDQKGAVGYLVGAENAGIAAMFTMMNNARISVGVQGLGLMERSYQQARDFAKSRIQSRPIENSKAAPVTIIHHPDVRRMLLSMKAHTEAARALAYDCGFAVDASKHSATPELKSKAAARVDFLTPIVKGWLTDLANEMTSTAVQIFGGMGYIEDTGIAQHMRDARILAIYEGTNGIQANDLVFRKLVRDNGDTLRVLTDEIDALIKDTLDPLGSGFATITAQLARATETTKDVAHWLLDHAKTNPALAAAAASAFLRLCGNLLGGYHLIRAAAFAQKDLDANQGEKDFLESKILTARFFAAHILPHCTALAQTMKEGSIAILDAKDNHF